MNETPQHIAIIMDGNRRWAKRHALAALQGHDYVSCKGQFSANPEAEDQQWKEGESEQDMIDDTKTEETKSEPDVPFNMCSQIVVPAVGAPDHERKVEMRNTCCKCITGSDSSTYGKDENGFGTCSGAGSGTEGTEGGLYTAVGCVPASGEGIITNLVRLGLGIAGGVALLMILAAGFMLSTSKGEPKKAGEARELITSAVMGLLFIIFSVVILQFIGVTVLRIPGFGETDSIESR